MSNRHPLFQILSRTHSGCMHRMPSCKNRCERRFYRTEATPVENTVVTLDPNKFGEKKQQRLCIGNKFMFTARVQLFKSRISHRFAYDFTGCPAGTRWPSPPDTKAFLYYITPPGRPRIASELRLRVTPSDDPASFASGSDLLRKNGQVWSRPLFNFKTFIPLYQKLREDGLVPDDLDSILSTFPGVRRIYSQTLFTLDDPFIVEFSRETQFLSVVTEQGMTTMPFRRHFFDARQWHLGLPYTGSAMARFERSTLPDHKGTRTVVLRLLKIITPVKCVMPLYDGLIGCPTEGELYYRRLYSVKPGKLPAWSVNIDKLKRIMVPGLRLLWDA